MYENQNRGIQVYFKNHHSEYLLVETPDIIKDIVGETKVDRHTGIHMTKEIKAYGLGRIRD
jgi:hypothetical protein